MSGSNDNVSALSSLNVFAKQTYVGNLIFEQPRVCRFHYGEQWIKEGYAISPALPLTNVASAQSVINFLRNLFPEGSAFEALLESENLSKNNLYAILNTIGHDTAGALSFFAAQPSKQKSTLRLLSDQEIAARLSSAQPTDISFWDGKFRLSVAGVQNKLNVLINNGQQLYLADGDYASTHILKFGSKQFPSIIVNELFCMRLAKAVGLDVAEVKHRKFVEHSALVVTRFDRRVTDKGIDKRHMIDGCQALDLPPEYKYEQNFGAGVDVAQIRDGVSLKKLFGFTPNCAVPVAVTHKLIDWLLFNLIIGNSDAHGKNVSFFVNSNGITLSPFYDLVSIVYEAQNQPKLDTQLAMAIGDNFDINRISAFNLLSFADNSAIKFDLLKRRLDSLALRCQNLLSTLDFSQDGLSQKQMEDVNALTQLVEQRSDALLMQSRQFKVVIQSAFN